MMRLSQRVVLYRIIGMPCVHFALFLHALYRILYSYFQNKYGTFCFHDASSWFQAEVIAAKLLRAVKKQHETGCEAPALPLRNCCEGIARLSRSSGDAVTKASRSRC